MARARHPTYAERKQRWTTYKDPALRKGRMGRPYRRWRDKVLEPPVLRCCRCGYLIDKRLRHPHPMSPSADHYPIPLSRGGRPCDPDNGAPAHLRCNQSHGNGGGGMVAPLPRPSADRRW